MSVLHEKQGDGGGKHGQRRDRHDDAREGGKLGRLYISSRSLATSRMPPSINGASMPFSTADQNIACTGLMAEEI